VRDLRSQQPVHEQASRRRRDRTPFRADRRTDGDPDAPDARLGVHIHLGTRGSRNSMRRRRLNGTGVASPTTASPVTWPGSRETSARRAPR
jgi:hypothetical protein